jgi:uncharacterized protein YjbJ (UPF0337 family)
MPIHFETHRNCITNDLFTTVQLLDEFPEMRMAAELSHYVVDREMPCPPTPSLQELISLVLARSDSFQGRVASRSRIQVALGFPQHEKWVQLFQGWWKRGFELPAQYGLSPTANRISRLHPENNRRIALSPQITRRPSAGNFCRRQSMSINKDQVEGRVKEAAGKVQETAGKAVGSTTQQVKGAVNKVTGAAQAKYGDIKSDIKDANSKQEREERRSDR